MPDGVGYFLTIRGSRASTAIENGPMSGKAVIAERLNDREREILARISGGLSDQQIADELFLSLNTVKWYNRQIYGKLGVGSRTQAVAKANSAGILDEGGALSPASGPGQNLPVQLTPFIGRTAEMSRVRQLLDRSRLLTLTGTGGTGKTRLAIQVAADMVETFPDGVWFVDLAPLSDPSLVPKTIARTLGIFESPAEPVLDTLNRVLARRDMLLLIDNFEHLMPAASLIAALLASSPRPKIMVTSREPLHLAGEQEYFVPPLSLPAADASVQELVESEAGSLFIQQARMTLPGFPVNSSNAPTIARICARLDGIPLAIELAAARSRFLTPQALLERLGGATEASPLRTLGGGARDAPLRHRTLWHTLNWSFDLLEEDEKTLFGRLAVFRGGRSLEAIEAVCGAGLTIDAFDGLASLVDKSLVLQKETSGGEPRFVLLEMIHEYAREQLEASGEAQAMRLRHAEYFVELAERAEPELRLSQYDYWCRRFELELDNIRAILEWALGAGDISLGVRLAAALGLFWYGKGYHVEGIRWTQRLLDRLDETPVKYHAPFLISAGRMAWMNDLDLAASLFERAIATSRELEDTFHVAWALAFLGYVMHRKPEKGMPLAETSLALFREMDHKPGIAQALNIIGELARISGDDERAAAAYEECLAVCRETGETLRMRYNYVNLAYLAQHAGDHERALSLMRRAFQSLRASDDKRDIASYLVTFAGSIAALGQLQRAVRLLGASESALERMGAFHQPTDKPEIDRVITELRSRLDPSTFQILWNEGREMTLSQALDDVLEE